MSACDILTVGLKLGFEMLFQVPALLVFTNFHSFPYILNFSPSLKYNSNCIDFFPPRQDLLVPAGFELLIQLALIF